MKPCVPKLLLGIALALPTHFCHAQTNVPAPLAGAITQLDNDLLAIPAGATITDAQHQAILADLNTLVAGIVPAPAASDLDAVAMSLGSAAAAGNVTADSLAELNGDLAADASDADDWLDDITDAAATLLQPDNTDPDPGDGGDPSLPIETVGPTFATAAPPRPRLTQSDHLFTLDTQSGQSPANQFYYGRVEFVTRQFEGSAAKTKVYVQAVGVPLNNPYTVTVTRKSDGAVVNLGKMAVQAVSAQRFNLYLTADIPDDYDENVEILSLGNAILGGDNPKKALPTGFDGRDVAAVTLTDAQGVARLSGRPGTASWNSQKRSVILHLHGDPTIDPAALARVKGVHTGLQGRSATNSFTLDARHLPASTTVTLMADGVAIGEFTTGPQGRLVVAGGNAPTLYSRSGHPLIPQKLPTNVDLSRIKSLTLTDAQGHVLLSDSSAP